MCSSDLNLKRQGYHYSCIRAAKSIMDNITHTLIGIAAAEPLALRRPARDRARLWIASAVANNLPDLDVLYTWGAKDRLTYMLHHRGHSHTLLVAPLLATLWLAILRIFWSASWRGRWTAFWGELGRGRWSIRWRELGRRLWRGRGGARNEERSEGDQTFSSAYNEERARKRNETREQKPASEDREEAGIENGSVHHDDIPWRELAALCYLGPLLHLFADAWKIGRAHV